VDWFNNRRLLEPIGNIPPAEAEERYYAMTSNPPWRRDSNETASGKPGAVQTACRAGSMFDRSSNPQFRKRSRLPLRGPVAETRLRLGGRHMRGRLQLHRTFRCLRLGMDE
jgi:hypothetical protein